MTFRFFHGEAQIGTATLFALDPPMGVAMAKFRPTEAYESAKYANVLDGDYLGDRTGILTVKLDDGTELKCNAVAIHDYPSLDEIEVHLLGIIEPSYDQLFADHPDFKS